MRSAPLVEDRSHHIAALDGLRAVAMLAVVGCHLLFSRRVPTFDLLDRIAVRGWLGVDLFFVLSGFLITGILVDTRAKSGYFATFYKRRALRIFPIYYLLLVILIVWIPFGSWYFGHSMDSTLGRMRDRQVWYWTHLVNVAVVRTPNIDWGGWTGHLWSLSVEEQFYLLWPAVVFVTPRRHLAKLCVFLMVAAAILRAAWLWAQQPPVGAYILMPMRMDSLAVGALIAVLARTNEGTLALRRWYRRIGGIALAVGVPLFVLDGNHSQDKPIILAGYSVAAITFGALIVWLLDDPRPRRLFEWGALRRVGRISYGGYLYHLPLIALCAGWKAKLVDWGGAGGLAYWAAHLLWISSMVALTLLVATVSYRVIERPFLDLKDRPLNFRIRRAAAIGSAP
jgi:peptidoglycan/LPS O-acetylase OafA/YrhL